MKVFWIAILALLTGCTTPSSESPAEFAPIVFAGQKASSAERTKCETAGGVVQRAGRLGAEYCIQPYPDAGKACVGESDCLGKCLQKDIGADTAPGTHAEGICQADTNDFGCKTIIEGGKIKGTLCVD